MAKDTKDLLKAKKLTFNLLKIRPRSEYELVAYLTRKGFSKEIIKQTIDYLSRLRLVDDLSFARAWAESKAKQSIGKTRLRFELLKKGLKPNIINQVIEETFESVDEEKTVRGLVQRMMQKYSKLDKDTAKRRLWSYLSRRGFSKDIVMDVMSQL